MGRARRPFFRSIFLNDRRPGTLNRPIGEDRYRLIDQTSRGRLVVVAHTDRGEAVRLISARLTTRRERKDYEQEA